VPTPIANAVTGINHPVVALQRARRAVSERAGGTGELPPAMPVDRVKVGLVAFIELQSEDACKEMRIGLGRVEKVENERVQMAWWDLCNARCGVSGPRGSQ